MRQVRVEPGIDRVVVTHRFFDVKMMADRLFDSRESSIVKECRLQRRVAKRRTAKLVSVVLVARNLFQTKILILIRPVKDYVSLTDAKERRNLWNADVMHLEIAE